jgi:hypothetical protein
MAENIWDRNSPNYLMDAKLQRLIAECKRQEESCLYTSTAIYEWLKSLRYWRIDFIVVPIIFGAIATWPLLAKQVGLEWMLVLIP